MVQTHICETMRTFDITIFEHIPQVKRLDTENSKRDNVIVQADRVLALLAFL